MNQHRLARLKLRQGDQAMHRREESGRHAGPQLQGQGLRPGHAEVSPRQHMAGQAAGGECRQHPLSHQMGIHPLTNSQHPSHRFTTEGQRACPLQAQALGMGAQQAEGIEHIAEVEARGLHLQLQLTRHQLRRGQGLAVHTIQTAAAIAEPLLPLWRQMLQPRLKNLTVVPTQFTAALAAAHQLSAFRSIRLALIQRRQPPPTAAPARSFQGNATQGRPQPQGLRPRITHDHPQLQRILR